MTALVWLGLVALFVALCAGIKHYDRLDDERARQRAAARRRVLDELDRIYDQQAD